MEKSVWSYRDISVKLKLLLYNTLVLPIAIYGSERLSLMQLDTKKLSILKNNICVCCMISCSELFLSQDGIFHCLQVLRKKSSCHQPWWQPLVNTSLISQFWENVSRFNFLANALILFCLFCVSYEIPLRSFNNILKLQDLCLKLSSFCSFTTFWWEN